MQQGILWSDVQELSNDESNRNEPVGMEITGIGFKFFESLYNSNNKFLSSRFFLFVFSKNI